MSGLRYLPKDRRKEGSVSANSADALYRRGVKAYQKRKYAEAVNHFKAAVVRRPKMVPWHTALGAALRAAGRLPDAIAVHRRAIELDPSHAPAHNNLGNALKEAGDLAGAEGALREACRFDWRYAEARLNLALVLRARNRLAEAERFCREALQLNPSYLEAKAFLGHLLLQKADFEGAAECFRTACTGASFDVGNFMNLGVALEALGRFDEADAAYEMVVSWAPQLPQAHFALGRRLEQRGEAEKAAEKFRQALATDPNMASAYLSLSRIPRYGLTEEERGKVASLLEGTGITDDDRSSLLYALGHSAERERKYDKAFHLVRLANDIDHRRTGFNEIENIDFIKRTAATFDANCWAGLPQGSDSDRPDLIVGMPRSGTTLVEQIIASHPAAAGGGELVELPEIANGLARGDGAPRPYPECVLDLTAMQTAALAERYLARLQQVDRDALRVTDKLPFNFRHLGLITALFPRARIVHCRRDPRDIAVSCYFIKFHRPISFACNLFELGAYLRHYQFLMAHWRRVLPQPMLEIQYEDLVTDPERHVRRIIDFCGLPWDEACLNFYSAERTLRTASVNQVRRPMYVSSIGRWKLYGKHLAPLYAELEGRLPPKPRGRPVQEG